MRVASLTLLFFSMAAASFSALYAHEAELHTFHCLHGCPIGAPATNDVVVRENYTLSSNDLTKMADWVAYRITGEGIGASGERDWEADPWLSVDETLRPDAYDGASTSLHIDRGHQVPLASFSGTATADETNVMSNITPQSSALNQGPWVKVEDRERNLATRGSAPVYVLTGPLFERLMRPLPAGGPLQRVPSGYWKVVALADGRATAFIFDQTASRRMDPCEGRVSLTHLQLRARLLLFPRSNAGFTTLDPDLGCMAPPPADPLPSEIPEEKKQARKVRPGGSKAVKP